MNKKYDVRDSNCPSRKILEIIGDKWTILIVDVLAEKTCRFGELRRETGGISQKMLTQTLRKLEKYGLIVRHSYPVLPLKVEYSLTPLGENLSRMLEKITDWAERNVDAILQAQKKYEEAI